MTVAMPNVRDTAEMTVLGAILLSEPALDLVLKEGVRPDHFWRPQHQAIFAGMLALRDQGHAVDDLTLKARFDSPQSPVSGADIDLLTVSVPNLGNLRDYCRIVRAEAWFDTAQRAVWDAQEAIKTRDRGAVVAALSGVGDEPATPEQHKDTATEFMDWYESDIQGWPLPFSQLIDATGGGLFPGEVTVIGSWSGFGKTFLLSQILRGARRAGADVLELASEMHGPKRTARTLTSMTGIPAGLIQHKRLTKDQLKEVLDALKCLPYETVQTNGWPVEQYCRELRRRKPDVAAIDTCSNLPCSRIDEWDRAATMLADTAAQTGTHLIQVFQLNLERDKGKRPPPVARDLRFGGTFYARARVVLFLHRDQESKAAGDGEVIWLPTLDGHIRLDKATHGDGDPVKGFLPVSFNTRWLRFDEDVTVRPLEAVA